MRFILSGVWLFLAASLTISTKAQETPEAVIPQHIAGDIVYGSDDAPVTVIEYASYTCPHCATFSTEVMPYLQSEFIDTGKIKFIFRNFVRDRVDMAVALASRCTSDVEKAKKLSSIFFAQQHEWMHTSNPMIAISSIAYTEGLDLATLNLCLANTELMNSLVATMKEGHEAYEIKSVPAIIINGVRADHHSHEELKEKIALAAGG